MTTGGNCSAPSTASRKSARLIFGGWRTRHSLPITERWELSSLAADLLERVPRRREVDNETTLHFLLCLCCCSCRCLQPVWQPFASLGAVFAAIFSTGLAANSDSEAARISSRAAEAL